MNWKRKIKMFKSPEMESKYKKVSLFQTFSALFKPKIFSYKTNFDAHFVNLNKWMGKLNENFLNQKYDHHHHPFFYIFLIYYMLPYIETLYLSVSISSGNIQFPSSLLFHVFCSIFTFFSSLQREEKRRKRRTHFKFNILWYFPSLTGYAMKCSVSMLPSLWQYPSTAATTSVYVSIYMIFAITISGLHTFNVNHESFGFPLEYIFYILYPSILCMQRYVANIWDI